MNNQKQYGIFITFEGGEGSGKTTQVSILYKYLVSKGVPVVRTREPGGTELGDQVRRLVLNGSDADFKIDPRTELFLYLASRSQHIIEVIRPALTAGKVVLCDRFTDATIAYQGDGRGLPKKEVKQMAKFASYGIEPDLTFLLDINVKEGLARLSGRKELNRLDLETVQFHEAVYRGYLTLAEDNPSRIEVIDARGTIEETSLKIRKRADALLS